jgi:hypothetical protein
MTTALGVLEPERMEEENIVGIAVQALSELQDYISEATHTPWPGTTRQPSPQGRILNAHLNLWYADNGNVILSCDPIPLAEGDSANRSRQN